MALMLAVIGYQFKVMGELSSKLEGIKDKYVRRDDNDGQIGRIEKTVTELKADTKDMQSMLVRVLVALGKQV